VPRRSASSQSSRVSNAERFISPLQGIDNIILTPHTGGSTEEAQRADRRGGRAQADRLQRHWLNHGRVSFPQARLPARPLGTLSLSEIKSEYSDGVAHREWFGQNVFDKDAPQ
jgi:hypothetical protein